MTFLIRDRWYPGKLVPHKWELTMSVQETSWGFDRRMPPRQRFLSVYELLHQMISTVAFGGNILMNIGPTHDGRIVGAFRDRLTAIGKWLNVNGDAIYESKPWTVAQNETDLVYYTTDANKNVYAIFFNWPDPKLN